MHPQLGYQFALDRGRELQAAAEADRLARSVGSPERSWWRRAKSARSSHQPEPIVAFPQTMREALDEVGAVVEALGPKATGEHAAPVVQSLVEEFLAVAKEARIEDLPTAPRPGEPAVVGYRTLTKIGLKTSKTSDIILVSNDAKRIGFAIADLRALQGSDGPGQADAIPAPATTRQLLPGRALWPFVARKAGPNDRSTGDDCVSGLQVCA